MSDATFNPDDLTPEEVAEDLLRMSWALVDISRHREDETVPPPADTPLVFGGGPMTADDLAQVFYAYLNFDTSTFVRRIRQQPPVGILVGGAVRVAAQLLNRDPGLASLEFGSPQRNEVLVAVRDAERQIAQSHEQPGGGEGPGFFGLN